MAASSVDICNGALIQIGVDTIASLGDSSKRAQVCNHFYTKVRDATLREYPWKCAKRYIDFGAALASAPEFTYAYAFLIPTSPLYVLRVLECSDPSQDYRIVGREVYSNASTFKAICVVRIVDEAKFDALFYEAFEAHLSAVIAWPLTKNSQLRKEQWQVYQARLQAAQEIDSQEDPPEEFESNVLIDVRAG